MAKPSLKLIKALRRTAEKLAGGAAYQWGHMGCCNCGRLAQELANISQREIHHYAMQRNGDWATQSVEYCPTSGYPMDMIISKMLGAGLQLDDLERLENLSDPEVLKRLPPDERNLKRNCRTDVVKYLEAWARLLDNQRKRRRLVRKPEPAPTA